MPGPVPAVDLVLRKLARSRQISPAVTIVTSQAMWKAFRANSFSLSCFNRQHLRHWDAGGGYHADSRVH